MSLTSEIHEEQRERQMHRRRYHLKDRQIEEIVDDLNKERRLIDRLQDNATDLERVIRKEAERDATGEGLKGEEWEARVSDRLDAIPGQIAVADHHRDVILVTLTKEQKRRGEIAEAIRDDDERIEHLQDRRRKRREDNDGKVSEFFHLVEFSCKCFGAYLPPQDRFIAGIERFAQEVLDPFRRAFGPTAMTSAWRTGHNCGCSKPGYDASVGGVGGNHVYEEHLKAPATDLVPQNGSPASWAAWGRAHNPGGTGYYPNSGFVHLDPRVWEGRPRASWTG